ncbi:MAG: amino acid adenylation domain-containing protein [Bacteroidota bacterium]
MLLLAAFQALLSRYSGQEDICIGTPIANRTQAEVEGLIGLFINTLVLRGDLRGDPTFSDLLKRVRELTLGAYAHQDLPFETLVDSLQLNRDMSHTPLFQVMFILQNVPQRIEVLPDIHLSQVNVEMGTATFDMTMSVTESPEGILASMEYNTDLFDATTIRRLMRHFAHLLGGVASDPGQRLSQLPVLSRVEEHQIVREWNIRRQDLPARCVHQLIETEAASQPDNIAVVSGDARMSYGELNSRANKLARHLMKLGAGPEVRVGMCMEKSLEMIIGVLGVLKSGAAYVPLDPAQPPERLEYMVRDSNSAILLTQADLVDSLPFVTGPVLCLDRDWSLVDEEPDGDLALEVPFESLAYMIYTSGTTGKPKGTIVSHRSLLNAYLAWEKEYTLKGVARSHLQMANFAFDVFSGDFVRALCSGGKLVLCRREYLLDAERLYDLMVREEVTIAEFVPAVLRNLIQHLEVSGVTLEFMKVLIAGSDVWYVGEYKKFLRFIGPGTRLINSFGLTEATIDTTYFEATDLDLPKERLVPIGRPFANSQVYILDRNVQPTPVGVNGEIYVGGMGLARGYHERADLTAEKFVPNPFPIEAGERLYRTGDLARYLPDGNIEFLGRADHQVKVRGFRVELGEIETAIARHPAVQEGVVLVREDSPGDKALVAYVVPNQADEFSTGDLRRFLLEKVPDYMVPSAFVVLEALPLTPNGKVDRKALPAPDRESRDTGEEYIAPRTAAEEVLAGLWSDVLEVEKVGVHDNFFLLGGHSLLATQLVSRIRKTFEVELPLRKVFETPTVAALAEAIETEQRRGTLPKAPPIVPVDRTEEMPLSFAQQRLWFLDQLEPDNPFYNLPEIHRVHGPMDVSVLERALNEVVRRHENLRSSIQTVEGKPVQKFASGIAVPIPVVDLTEIPKEDQEKEIHRRAAQEAWRPIPLDRAPLFRLKLLQLAREEHVILLIMHHVISDEWSSRVLVQEIAVLYDAYARGAESPLPDLPIQYADFAHWQRNWMRGEVLEKQLSYWKNQLAGSPPLLELPTDRPRPPVQTFWGSYRKFDLSEKASQGVRELCQREGVTPFMVLVAVLKALLYRYSGQADINIGSPIANRNRAEIEGLIGFFVNTLVLRTNLEGNPSFRELLGRVRDVALGGYAHQDVPFEMIVDNVQPDRDLSHSPLFQVMFVLQTAAARSGGDEMQDLSITPVEAHSGTSKFDMTFFMIDDESNLRGALEYNTDLFDASTIDRLVKHFGLLLEALVADPEQLIASVPLLTEAERHQLIVDWNRTDAEFPCNRSVQELFESQSVKSPEAVAVVFGEERWTYEELDRRSNRFASYLRRSGVGAEVLVGICMERSVEMVVALLGVLKAGGAYLPVDPSYPPERIEFMITDSGARMVLTQARLEERIPRGSVEVICVDRRSEEIAKESDDRLPVVTNPESLAYVIYTSGSTGKPKGVMVHHRGVVNYLTWCQTAYPLGKGDGAPVHSPISFDLTVTSVFAPLVSGRSVHLLPEDLGVETMAEAFRGGGDFSLVKLTPAHLDVLSKQLSREEAKNRTAAFIIGGENLLSESIRFWQDASPETALINEYGPTETVVGCCVYQVRAGEKREGSVPIGRPIINTRLYILDEFMQEVPIGVAGELYIGGAGVARGYLQRPDLTAERFVPDRFGLEPGRRLYKTGDLCRYLADGNIEFIGRRDEQVKIRGFRVELGEIESVLSNHPSVEESVVIVKEDENGNKRLVAYLVSNEEGLGIPAIRSYLQERVPEYMVPALFMQLEILPLTPNGKVDRRALPDPSQTRESLETEYVAPDTAAETTLAEIWKQVLGVTSVGIDDNFFELGGDSILTIQVIARANQAGLRLTPKLMFQHQTIRRLSSVAEEGKQIVAEQGLVTGPVPLTPIQYWFFEQNLTNRNHWNQSLLLEVQERLDGSILNQVVSQLMHHHDVLRSTFQESPAGWQQVIEDPGDNVPFSWTDLSGIPAGSEAAAIEKTASEVQASLDISHGPIFRVAYLDLGEGRTDRILIAIHHLVVDGVSWGILLEDFQEAYRQLIQGGRARLSPKTSSFQLWSLRLRDYASGETLREEASYWSDLCRTTVPRLPVDFSEGANTEDSARSVAISLTSEETHALLREVPGVYRTDINDILLASLAHALSSWTQQPRFLINLEGHGRESLHDDVDVSRTAGWFTALSPVFLTADNVDPAELITSVKEQLRRIPGKGVGYGILRYLSTEGGSDVGLNHVSPPELSFNYLGQLDRGHRQGSLIGMARESRGPDRCPSNIRTHLIEVDGGVAGGQLQMEWTYSRNVFQHSTIEKLAGEYLAALRGLIQHCLSTEGGSFTASDFADFGWTDDDLNDIVDELSKSSR